MTPNDRAQRRPLAGARCSRGLALDMVARSLKVDVTSLAWRSFVKAVSLNLQVRAVDVSSDDVRAFQLVPERKIE